MALRENGHDASSARARDFVQASGVESEVSPDEVFEVLSNYRRRYAIHLLKHRDERTSIGELAEQIAAWENNTHRDSVTAHERKLAYNALQQRHLPKLDALGIVNYDHDRGVVDPTPALDDVSIYAEVTAGRQFPWSDYYLGLTVVNSLLLAGIWFNGGTFGGISGLSWAIFCVTTYAVSALAHAIATRRMALGETEMPPELTNSG